MPTVVMASNGQVQPRFQRKTTSVAERSSAAIASWRTSSANAKLIPTTNGSAQQFDFTASVSSTIAKNPALERTRQDFQVSNNAS
jgi:hypothetical protein